MKFHIAEDKIKTAEKNNKVAEKTAEMTIALVPQTTHDCSQIKAVIEQNLHGEWTKIK